MNRPLLWPLLGASRFFLALVVAASHLMQRADCTHSPIVRLLDSFGPFWAVLAFLVISGYSIGASYEKSPKGFYRRRLLRVWPLYILSIVAGCAAVFGTSHSRGFHGMPPTADIIQNLFFLQGWTTYSIITNAVVWSLSIEVVCYVLTPLFARLSQPMLLIVALASELIYFAYPFLAVNQRLPVYLIHGQGFALLLWVWLSGFIIYRSKWNVKFGAKLKGSEALATVGTVLGDASYPLYLFHLPLYNVITRLEWHLAASLMLAMAIVLAVLLDRYFDQPFKLWISGRRAGTSRAAVLTPAVAAAR